MLLAVAAVFQVAETPAPEAIAKVGENAAIQETAESESSPSQARDIQVPPPPFSEDIFPCMDCHEEIEPNSQRRELEDFHEEIVLRHDEENRWCLDCHDAQDRDKLRLASGKTVSFEESYRLCGQCHGPKLRDWKAGVHGKRTGRWDGKERYYLLCVHCHNPHKPRFPPIKPMPKPLAPAEIRDSLTQPYEPIVLPKGMPERASGTDEDE